MARATIRSMGCGEIYSRPVNFDWSEGYGETWETTEATRCEKCGAIVIGSHGDEHRELDSASECRGYVPQCDGPMMSYYYPCAIDDTEDAARKLVDTCLCVVTVNGTTGLALTGGGMDLSWEIAEAFLLLGELPPVHFAGLPGMAGRGTSRRDRWIVAGCLKSCAVAAGRARDRAKRLRRMVADAKTREVERSRKEAV